jgi:hypothetical protein
VPCSERSWSKAAIVREDDFYRDAHRRIFRAIARLAARGTAIDPVTVKDELALAGDLDAAGGQAAVPALLDGVPLSANAQHYAQIVAEKSRDRAALRATEGFQRAFADRNGVGPGEGRESVRSAAATLRSALEALEISGPAVLLPADDLVDVVARPIKPTPWAAHGLVAEGDLGILSGKGGIGKSWLALTVALDLAIGRPVLGRFPVTRPYRIAIVDLESRPWEADQRLQRIVKGTEVAVEGLAGMVRLVRERLRFDHEHGIRRLLASLREWKTDFLIVDSFRRLHGGDENKSEIISSLFLEGFDRLRSETGAGVLAVDHERKPTGDKGLDGPETALRGSGDKRNMVDWHVGVEARKEHLAVIPTKTRHSRLPGPFRVVFSGLGEGDPEYGPVAVQYLGDLDPISDKVQDAILGLLDDAGDAGLLRELIIEHSNYGDRSVDKALQGLRGRGLVERKGEGRKARYTRLREDDSNDRTPPHVTEGGVDDDCSTL